MSILKYITALFALFALAGCEEFEEFNENPNEPTEVSADVLLPSTIRQSVNTSVDAAFLVGNNAAQLSAKTLRLEVDAYNWNAFPTYWEGWYEALTDAHSVEDIALEGENEVLEGVALVMQAYLYSCLTNAYGDIPYSQAIKGDKDNFTPMYDRQADIYGDILANLEMADNLLSSGNGTLEGDILYNGDPALWRKFANSLRLRLLMYAGDKIDDGAQQFSDIVNEGNIIESNTDNAVLTYTGAFPNEFPLIPLKQGDFDAVALGKAAYDVMDGYQDPRLMRFARPNNEDFTDDPQFIGAINGQGEGCSKDGASRLGVQYYNYPDLTLASNLNLPMAEGLIMTHAEVEFLLAEGIAKGWISGSVEEHYRDGIQSSMEYYLVDLTPFGWSDFDDYYNNSGVAYSEVTDIWEQKWLALFFTGLEPYFEVRRWYVESGKSFSGIPFLEASCGNVNSDNLPLRFLYPGEEQSLNAENYDEAVNRLGGSNNQNAEMWLVQD
jgi:hypothetical protein